MPANVALHKLLLTTARKVHEKNGQLKIYFVSFEICCNNHFCQFCTISIGSASNWLQLPNLHEKDGCSKKKVAKVALLAENMYESNGPYIF